MATVTELLTIEEVAQALGTNKQSVYRRIWDGEIPTINIGKAGSRPRLRVDPADLEAYKDARKVRIPTRRRRSAA